MSDKKPQPSRASKDKRKQREIKDSEESPCYQTSAENICTRESQEKRRTVPKKQSILRSSVSYKSTVQHSQSVTLLLPQGSEHMHNASSSDSDTQSERHKKHQKFDEMRRRHYHHMYCNPETKTNALGEVCDPKARHVIPDQDTSDDE